MRRHRAAFGVSEDAHFDEARFVIEDAYRGGSDHLKKRFEDAPHHREAVYNEYCAATLDYARGTSSITRMLPASEFPRVMPQVVSVRHRKLAMVSTSAVGSMAMRLSMVVSRSPIQSVNVWGKRPGV